MPRSPAKSLTSTAASPPDTSLDPPRDAEEVRLWRNGVGLDYWIWPGRTSRLGSSLNDHFGRLPARTLPAQLPDDADAAPPGVQGCRALLGSGTRTRRFAARSAGSATSRATGSGWQHCRDWFPVYRVRTRRRGCDLRFGQMIRLRQDRGLCLSGSSICS